jgi:hypothetical protein
MFSNCRAWAAITLMRSFRSMWTNTLVPRVVFLPYWSARIILSLVGLVTRLKLSRNRGERATKLCIECGIRGWELLEYKELYASACEYLGEENVQKVAISGDEDYVRQVRRILDSSQPTHYVFDPRTGAQRWWPALRDAFKIATLLCSRRIVPIVILTDLSVRLWRAEAAVVSARDGVVVNFLAPREVAAIFPHRRLIGPSLMPLSVATFEGLRTHAMYPRQATAIFTGSLYEPRTTTLNTIKEGLAERGFSFQIMGRQIGSPRISDREYWARLQAAAIVVTTAEQRTLEGFDWQWVPSVVYRFLEATACGALLVAPDVPGIRRFFTPGEHYVSFANTNEAVEQIVFYLSHEDERKRIALRGYERAQSLVYARVYWSSIDIGLGAQALT